MQPGSPAIQLLADEILKIVTDIALRHGDAHGKRHHIPGRVFPAVGRKGILNHADLRAVAVGDHQLIALFNQIGNGLCCNIDGIHLFL